MHGCKSSSFVQASGRGASRKSQPCSSKPRNAASPNPTFDVQRPDSGAQAKIGRSMQSGRPRVYSLFALFRFVSQPFTILFTLAECIREKRFDDSEPENHAGCDAA